MPIEDRLYRAAMVHCANSILPMHFGEKLVNKIFGRNLQSHAAGLLAVMHCRHVLGLGPAPTLTAIQQSFGSSRTLASFFALLRFAGYLKSIPSEEDRRVSILIPQPLLLNGLRTWLSHHLACCEILESVPAGTAARIRDDDDHAVRLIAHSMPLLEQTRASIRAGGAWGWFDSYDCGDRVALVLLKSHYEQSTPPEAQWLSLEPRQLAERLGVSHSHIRNILNAAEAMDYIRQDRVRHRIAVTSRFETEIRDWHLQFWGWLAGLSDSVSEDRVTSA